ncbi:MAG: sulfatase-like hydrolase/transferase [Opitutales bacterium]|nr:sulfatase-like hydrolase/transferase [Opitutales bacterium]
MNLLVFLTDDHGRWASSAYGNREIHSPVMRWLAETGIRFDAAYTPSPVCSPARASFWTGQIPSRHGVHDYLTEPTDGPGHAGIAGIPHLGVFLREAGYRTGMIGKWHAGTYARPMPGFDTWFTSLRGTNASFARQSFVDGDETVETFGHQETFLTDRALRFLREDPTGERPFFLFVGYTNPHTPHSGEPAPLEHHYRDAAFADIPRERPLATNGHARVAPYNPDEAGRRTQLASYFAAVENIDHQMLRLVAELENLRMLDNTLIVYTADHGHMNGHHGLHTKGNATLPPNFLDESIQVPLLVRPPGGLRKGRVVTQPVDLCDLFATLLDFGGADAASIIRAQGSPGRSFRRLPEDPFHPWRALQFCEYGPNRMARSATAKLIRRFPHPFGPAYGDEFYDLAGDPRETTNRIDDPAFAHVIDEMSRALDEHFSQYESPAASGRLPEALSRVHNTSDSWRTAPGSDDHRQ